MVTFTLRISPGFELLVALITRGLWLRSAGERDIVDCSRRKFETAPFTPALGNGNVGLAAGFMNCCSPFGGSFARFAIFARHRIPFHVSTRFAVGFATCSVSRAIFALSVLRRSRFFRFLSCLCLIRCHLPLLCPLHWVSMPPLSPVPVSPPVCLT